MSAVPAPMQVRRSHNPAVVHQAPAGRQRSKVSLRSATPADADRIYALLNEHLTEGRLLPRRVDEITAHAHRFVVAVQRDRLVGCADLAPLSRTVAEVRTLVVTPEARSHGLGRRIVDELERRAIRAGFQKLCAFTHAPAYFVEMGFSIVPHVWLPEKIDVDCRSCAHFRRCGQYAVLLPLALQRPTCVPLTSLHG